MTRGSCSLLRCSSTCCHLTRSRQLLHFFCALHCGTQLVTCGTGDEAQFHGIRPDRSPDQHLLNPLKGKTLWWTSPPRILSYALTCQPMRSDDVLIRMCFNGEVVSSGMFSLPKGFIYLFKQNEGIVSSENLPLTYVRFENWHIVFFFSSIVTEDQQL